MMGYNTPVELSKDYAQHSNSAGEHLPPSAFLRVCVLYVLKRELTPVGLQAAR
jgi:hypothetical protein